jgi:adenylate kinase
MLAEIGKPLDAVILLQVSDDLATGRLHARAAAEGRADDSPEAICNRLRLYHELTEPVVERYRAEGTLVAVDGAGTVADVATDIEDALAGVGARSR